MAVDLDVLKAAMKNGIATVENAGYPLPIKVPGRIFSPPSDQKFFEIFCIKGTGNETTWNDEEKFTGFLRIILHWPNKDEGVYTPVAMLEDIKADVPKGTRWAEGAVNLRTTGVPAIGDPIEDGHESLYVLTVPYEFFNVSA